MPSRSREAPAVRAETMSRPAVGAPSTTPLAPFNT